MGIRRARRDQLAHRAARQQLDARTVDPFEHLGWDADVGDDDVAGARFAGRQDQRQLRGGERHGHRRLDRVANRLVGIG